MWKKPDIRYLETFQLEQKYYFISCFWMYIFPSDYRIMEDEIEEGGSDVFRKFRYLTGILENEERKNWIRFLICGFLSAIIDLFSFLVTIYFLNILAGHSMLIGALQASVIVLMFFSEILIELYRCKISNRFLYFGAQRLSTKIYELFAKEDLEHHNQKSVMQELAVIRSDTMKCMNIILTCTELQINVFTMAGYVVILFIISNWFGVLISVVLFSLMAGIFFWSRVQMEAYGEKSRTCEIKTNAQITLGYGIFEEMKISGNMVPVLEKYDTASQEYALTQSEYSYKNGVISVLMKLWSKAIMLLLFAALLLSGINLTAFIPITVYISAISRMASVTYTIAGELNSIEFAKKSYKVLKECLDRYEELKKEEKELKNVRQKQLSFQKGISVRNLTFGYNEREMLFQNASIDIPSGHSVAVIGASGVGKTTFLALIMGLLRPQSGHVLYDDYDIVTQTDSEGACKAEIGDIVSYIPQTVYMNGETVRNNVAIFVDQASIDDERVRKCLECAQVWDDVAKMPEGINTMIGARGTCISGGQRQRIALARALYKDFELLIMDEATASLDMETEKAAIDSIKQVRINKTLLIVTHHISLTEECDMIYRIENKGFVRVK